VDDSIDTHRDSSSSKTELLGKKLKLRNFRLLMILYGIAAIVLAPLVILHKTSEVEISLKCNLMEFTIGAAPADSLISAIDTTALTLVNFKKVELGGGALELLPAFDADASNEWVQLGWQGSVEILGTGDLASITLENVKLHEFIIPERAVAVITMQEHEPNLFRVRVNGAAAGGKIQVDKGLRLSCNGCELKAIPAGHDTPSKSLRVISDRRHLISFLGELDWSTLALELPLKTKLNNHNIYLENGVYFSKLEGDIPISTIIGGGGNIKFEELKDKEIQIRAGDIVMLEDLKKFFIKSLSIDQGINVILHGSLGTLRTGREEFGKNRLPTYLEWLYSRHTWVLYLNALVLVVATFFNILKQQEYLGRRKEK